MHPPPADAPHGFVGQSAAILEIRRQIDKIGSSRSPVLLLGESGTGKEVVARSLHNAHPKGAFVPIDCGSLVGPLMESELFGHVKGAFTGASENKRGLIEIANGGTAFFDEIGDLPIELQVKLLRLLQEREYRPVGSLHRQKVEIRVIAATHRNLEKQVEQGTFREDLFYRLNVIKLRVPPLRDRRDDIPILVERFLSRAGSEYTVGPELMEALLQHNWPGNVRELQNCVHRMVAMNSGPMLHVADLPSAVQYSRAFSPSLPAPVPGGANTIVPLHELEKQAIMNAIRHTNGDRSVAAHLLGIGRTTLYRKLKEYNLVLESSARCYVQPVE